MDDSDWDLFLRHREWFRCDYILQSGGRRGLLETEKPLKKIAKNQKTARNFTSKLVLLPEVLSAYSIVSAGSIVAQTFASFCKSVRKSENPEISQIREPEKPNDPLYNDIESD